MIYYYHNNYDTLLFISESYRLGFVAQESVNYIYEYDEPLC